MVMRELLSILKRFEGPRVKGIGRVWRIDGSSTAIEECKTALLDAICSGTQPLVRYDEAPDAVPALKGTMEVTANTWRLPPRVPGSVVLAWLYMGNWQLYVADALIAEIPDLCRSSDSEVERFLSDSGVSVVIDSFHDDVSWVVGIAGSAQRGDAGDRQQPTSPSVTGP
jgi:hypothetical protein